MQETGTSFHIQARWQPREMYISHMYPHARILAITIGHASNSSSDNKGRHPALKKFILPFLRTKRDSRNFECVGSRIPGYGTSPSVWRMPVCVGPNESGTLLFTGSQELFNGCRRRQLINSPGFPDCDHMSGLCHLTNYIRMGKLAQMRNRGT